MGHLVIAMLLMTSCYGQPTWTTNISRPEVHSLSFYFHCLSGLEVMQPLTSSEDTLTDAKDTKTARVFWSGFRLSKALRGRRNDTHKHTHSFRWISEKWLGCRSWWRTEHLHICVIILSFLPEKDAVRWVDFTTSLNGPSIHSAAENTHFFSF